MRSILICLSLFISVLSVVGVSAIAANQAPTAKELTEGSGIPDKRDFPIDPKISPCDDFYQHVCKIAVDNFKLPADQSKWMFSFTDNRERILYARKMYLSKLNQFTPKSTRTQALKAYYMGCMDPLASARDEIKVIEREKENVLKLKTREELLDFAANLMDQPYFTFVGMDFTADQDDPDRWAMLLMGQGRTFPEKTYYDKAENLIELKKVAQSAFQNLGMSEPEHRAQNVVDFERALAKADLLPNVYRDRFSSRNDMDRAAFLKTYPHLHAEKMFARVPQDVKLRIPIPETLQFMEQALATYDVEQLKDVLIFHMFKDMMDDGYPQFFQVYFDFQHRLLGGPEKRRPLDERCAQAIDASFGKELDTELINILFKDFPTEKVDKLVARVRSSLVDQLQSNTWLSSATKKEAINKVKAEHLELVKPRNDRQWDYNPILVYSAETPSQNAIRLQKALIEKQLAEVKKPRNRDRWDMAPLVVNAYYTPTDNKFVLVQGILQSPFYDPAQSEVENFGAIGAVTGHEMGHGIDDEGSKYDEKGRLHKWMSDADLKEFHLRADRLVDQFNKLGHDGKLTLGENIGDYVGVTTAYRAAFANHKPTREEQQKFFYAYAKMWCQKVLPKQEEMLIKTNPHAMGWARVNGQVPNQSGFQEAFQCKAGDKLYREPKDRLVIW